MIANHEPQANKKFFDPAIFQKCWRGVGEQPTFAKQIILQSVFPAAIAARWQAKAGVEPPFAGR